MSDLLYDINELYAKYETLKEMVGADTLLETLVQGMSSDELQENLEFACKEYDEDFDQL